MAILDQLRDHIGHRDLSISHGGWGVSVIEAFVGDCKYLHLFLILPLNGEESWSHKPVEDFGETILPLGGCGETKNVFGAHLEEGLTEYFCAYMVGLVYNEGPYTLKVRKVVLL